MDLKNNASAAVQGTVDAKNVNTQNPAKANAEKGNSKQAAPEQGKADEHKAQGAQAEQPKPEETKSVMTAPTPEPPKPAMTIEERLKALELLNVRKTQYENLLNRIKDLEEFEFKQMEENDELQENPYTNCRLIIQDENRGQFSTTTPGLIKMVATFLKAACLDKKVELENAIIFPAA